MLGSQQLDPSHQYYYVQKEVGVFHSEEEADMAEIRPSIPIATEEIPNALLPRSRNPQVSQSRRDRKPVDTKLFPYGAVGVVAVKVRNGQPIFGMGTIVGEHDILTCAHILSGDHSVESVYYITAISGTKGRVFKALSWKVSGQYLDQVNTPAWNIGLIRLEQRGAARICGRLERKHDRTRGNYRNPMDGRIYRLEETSGFDSTGHWEIVAQQQKDTPLMNHRYQQGSPIVVDGYDSIYNVGIYVGGTQRQIIFSKEVVEEINRISKRIEGRVFPNVQLNTQGLAHLALSVLPNLRSISLPHNNIGNDGLRILLLGCWPRLESLELKHNSITDQGAYRLSRKDWFRLTSIDLSGNPIGIEGFIRLILAPWKQLTKLSCTNCPIDEQLKLVWPRIYGQLIRTQWRSSSAVRFCHCYFSPARYSSDDHTPSSLHIAIYNRIGMSLGPSPKIPQKKRGRYG